MCVCCAGSEYITVPLIANQLSIFTLDLKMGHINITDGDAWNGVLFPFLFLFLKGRLSLGFCRRGTLHACICTEPVAFFRVQGPAILAFLVPKFTLVRIENAG